MCPQEANKMVMDANLRRIQAEKLLKESNAKVQIDSLLSFSSNDFPILYNLVDLKLVSHESDINGCIIIMFMILDPEGLMVQCNI